MGRLNLNGDVSYLHDVRVKIVFGDSVGLTVGEACGVRTMWLLVGLAFKLLEGLAVGDGVGSYCMTNSPWYIRRRRTRLLK